MCAHAFFVIMHVLLSHIHTHINRINTWFISLDRAKPLTSPLPRAKWLASRWIGIWDLLCMIQNQRHILGNINFHN